MNVPELTPGVHPVIAACVGIDPGISGADIARAVAAAVPFIEENFSEPYPSLITSPEFAEAAAQIGPVALRVLMQPRALGLDFYCITDTDGQCHPDLRDITLLEELLEDELLLDELFDELLAEEAAVPVGAAPRFTG